MGKHLVQKEKQEKKIKIPKLNIKQENKAENVGEGKERKQFRFPVRRAKENSYAAAFISIALLILIQFCPLETWMLKLAYAIVLVYAATELAWDTLENIRLKEYFAAENLIALALILLFAINFNLEAVLIAIVYRICKILISRAEQSAWEKLRNISEMLPDSADTETAEGILRVQPEYVNVGDIINVKAGDRIPLDGVIVEGISTIDSSAISGQNSAWPVTEGHRVYSGCKNITSPIRVRVSRPFEQSTAKKLVKLAESSTGYYSRQEKFAIIIKRYYTLALLIASVLLCISLSAINGEWLENIRRASVVLVAALSSGSLVSISLAYIRTIGNACESGIFVKGSDCIESMAKTETMVFDKTGIVTEGRYVITDVFPNKVSEQQLLSMAATAERFSRHPIAAALREAAGAMDIDYHTLQIEEIPGRGVSAFIGEKQVYVGNTALLEEHGIKCAVPTRSGAAIHVAVDYKYWGHILVTDRIRRGAFDSLENLRANGIKKLVLLTGDVLSVAKPLASKLNFDMLRAELKPSEKLSAIEFLMSNRGESTSLAFVGDGNSDPQIMSRVDAAIILASLGSDTAFSSGDVLVMDRDIRKLPIAIKLSRASYHIALENIIAWMALNVLLVILGAIGVLPVLAAILIEFILVCAVLVNVARIR